MPTSLLHSHAVLGGALILRLLAVFLPHPVAANVSAPSIQTEPTDVHAAVFTPASLFVTATGAPPLTYQWRFRGVPISGQQQPFLGFPRVTPPDAGPYDVVISNPSGSITSRVAQLTVGIPNLPDPAPETPGPSTRRTGIVVSEVHLHPNPSPGRDLRFVELYNSNPFPEDLSGWSFQGDFQYTMPPGTRIPGLARLAIAPRPADIEAAHSITQVLGGFPGPVAPYPANFRLHNRSGAVVIETDFSSDPIWDAAHRGGGPSLVLTRPSLGHRNPMAWSPSTEIGGTPGKTDSRPNNILSGVVINEIIADPTPQSPGFIEVHNRSGVEVELDGARFFAPHDAVGWRFPQGSRLPARGFLRVTAPQALELLLPAGGLLFLASPDGTRLLDALAYESQLPGAAFGRSPDGSRQRNSLEFPTPASPNSRIRLPEIAFTEIHASPIDGNTETTFVEVHNRSPRPISLDGWRIAGGIRFSFPPDVVLGPNEFLAVARNHHVLRTLYPDISPDRILGDFEGTLRPSGERLILLRPVFRELTPQTPPTLPRIRHEAVESDVRFETDTREAPWSDAGGSSLEKIDLNAPPTSSSAWRSSDESRRAPWTTVEITGPLTLPHPGVPNADQLQVLLLGAGEALLDDVEVLVNGVNRVANPAFSSQSDLWFFQGTHRPSFVEPSAGIGNSPALHIVATERGDHAANRIRTTLTAPIPAGSLVTIRAKVRWLAGHPEILLRLRNGSLEVVRTLSLPRNPGTPGAPNSRSAVNTPPEISDVSHAPILPGPGQTTRILARVSNPSSGVEKVELVLRRDPGATIATVPMVDDGTGPDDIRADGIYSASFPGLAGGGTIAFQIHAVDRAGDRTLFPKTESNQPSEGLIRFGEPAASGGFGVYRVWMTQATRDTWSRRETLSNENLPVTFVSGTDRVIYTASARYSGSSYTAPLYDSPVGALCGYQLTFPPDDMFLGSTHATLDWPIRDSTALREPLMFWFLEQFGLPHLHRRHVRLFVNGIRRGSVYDDTQQPDSDTIEEWYPSDDEGSLWKTDCWNEFDNQGRRVDPCVLNTLERFPSSGPKKVARYRWNWRPRAVQSSANDFSDLFELIDSVNATAGYVPTVEAAVDVGHWMRTFVMNDLASYWDGFGNPNAKNTYLYKPTHDRWRLFSWDFDVGLGVFNDPTDAPLFDVNDPTIARMYRTPAFVRLYWAALREALDRWFRAGAGTGIDEFLNSRYDAFRAHGLATTSPEPIKSWINQRRSFLLRQLATVTSDFAITSNGGSDLTTAQPTLTLSGRAPVDVANIRIQGRDRTVTWTSVSNWSANISLLPGINELRIEGFDRFGQPVAGASRTFRITATGSSPPLPEIRINEWMASNSGAFLNPSTGRSDDWFELVNAGATTVDLSGFSLTDQPGTPKQFPIPTGYSLAPGQFLLVWADNASHANRPGGDLHTTFNLLQEGESILLSDPLGRTVDRVDFATQVPDVSEGRWTDGQGLPFVRFRRPTPGTANTSPPTALPDFQLAPTISADRQSMTLRWKAVPGRSYQIEVSPTLSSPEWRPISPLLRALSAEESWSGAPVSSGAGFFRVALQP